MKLYQVIFRMKSAAGICDTPFSGISDLTCDEHYYTSELSSRVLEQACGHFLCKSDRRSPKNIVFVTSILGDI